MDTLNKRFDSYNYFTYDLSQFVGKKVTVEIGITTGTHCAINGIEFGDGTVVATTSVTLKNDNGDTTVSLYESQVAENNKVYRLHDYVNSKATNGFVTLALVTETEYAELNGHVLTIKAGAPAGEYKVVATSVADANVKGEFVVNVEPDPVEIPDPTVWSNKGAILEDWVVNGAWHEGVGEGVDLHVDGLNGWSSIVLDEREIKNVSYILTMGARVFVRGGETNPRFVVKVTTDKGNEYIIRAIGANEDYVELDTTNSKYDSPNHYSYDLSQFIGMTVKVEIGVTQGTHSVITDLRFDGTPDTIFGVKGQQGKKSMILGDGMWVIVGDQDAGVGEGADIKGSGSYLKNTFTIGAYYNNLLTFQGRVFHRSGETYPEVVLIVVDGGQEVVVRAMGAETDYVYFDQDNLATFTYDLSQFVGKTVEVRLALQNAATHCVITYIGLTASEAFVDVDPYQYVWDGKAAILEGWEVVGSYDAGVGEGADLHVDGLDGWSSLKLEEREIKTDSYLLRTGARVFVRGGETNPRFVLKVTYNDETYIIKAVGSLTDYVEFDTTDAKFDSTNYYYYDLSQFVGQTVTVEYGITQGTHAVVQYLEFFGTEAKEYGVKGQQGKKDMILGDDKWVIVGDQDAGVGEGADIKGSGSYLKNTFTIGEHYCSTLTFQGRVFHRDGETYPEVVLVVVDGGQEIVVRESNAEADYVYFDQDSLATFTYDLSQFAGKTVEVRLALQNAATHCVITYIEIK